MISVIIPVGPNHVQHFPHALASVKGQAEVSRVIVVNDSGQPLGVPSIDGGRRGVAHARNLGAELATTPYLLFLDADDILMARATAGMLAGLPEARRAGAAYVYGDCYMSHADGRLEYAPAREYSPAGLLTAGVHVVSALLPADKAKTIRFDETLAGWEDWEYWMQWAARGWFGKRIRQPIIMYRQDTGARRADSYKEGNGLTESIRARYAPLLTGDSSMCCGKGSTMTDMRNAPESAPAGFALVEFTGQSRGARAYTVNGHIYRLGNNSVNKFARVPLADLAGLLENEGIALVNTEDAGDPSAALGAASSAPEDEAGGLDESFFAQSPAERMAAALGATGLPAEPARSAAEAPATPEATKAANAKKRAARKARAAAAPPAEETETLIEDETVIEVEIDGDEDDDDDAEGDDPGSDGVPDFFDPTHGQR